MPKPWRGRQKLRGSILPAGPTRPSARGRLACEEDLIARFRATEAGTAPSQDCRRLVDPDLPGDRRFVRAGQHVIVVMKNAAAVIILDVRHGRAGLRDASGSAGWRSRPDSLTLGRRAEPGLIVPAAGPPEHRLSLATLRGASGLLPAATAALITSAERARPGLG